jgi:hypothetical protein
MTNRWIRVVRWLAFVGATTVAIVGYRGHLRRDEAMAAAVRDLGDAVDRLQSAPAPSTELPRELVRRLRETATAPTPVPPAAAEPPTAAPPDRATADSEADKRQRAIAADRLATRFQSEARDAAWSESARQDLRRELDALETAKDQVKLVECRSTLCKVEGRFETTRTFTEMMKKLFVGSDAKMAHGGVMAPVVEVTADGQVRAEVYMARAGTSLPST